VDTAHAGNLLAQLEQVPDPRGAHGRRHGISAMLATVVCAVFCGARGYLEHVCSKVVMKLQSVCPGAAVRERAFHIIPGGGRGEAQEHKPCRRWSGRSASVQSQRFLVAISSLPMRAALALLDPQGAELPTARRADGNVDRLWQVSLVLHAETEDA